MAGEAGAGADLLTAVYGPVFEEDDKLNAALMNEAGFVAK